MQSIDDEIPDISGPVSLGTYKFTRRRRGNKYEMHRLSELQTSQEEEGQNKVTEAAPTSSAQPQPHPHPSFNFPPPTTLSSSQLSARPTHQTEAEFNNRILNRLDNPSLDRRSFHEPGPPHYDELNSSHSAANFPKTISSNYPERRGSQASGQATTFNPPAQYHGSTQGSSTSITPDAPSSEASKQIHPSFSPEYHSSNLHLTRTTNPDRQSSRPAFGQANPLFHSQDYSSNQNFNALTNTERRSPQASTKTGPSFAPPECRLHTAQEYNHFAKSFNALIKSNRQSPGASGQDSSLLPPRDFQQITSEQYPRVESRADDLLETHRQDLQASNQAHPLTRPKDYDSPKSLPLSDTLPMASFNLVTNQWDPDLPEAIMSAHTPTNKSTRGGHPGQQSSGKLSQSSYPRQDFRNPYAIVTTTKSGRPYTNPYMPIDPPPHTERQIVRQTPPGNLNLGPQSDDAGILERQRKTRYIDQEEAQYRALEQAKNMHAKESLDDPFQDQMTNIQQYERQPSNYTDYAAHQAAYNQMPPHGRQPAPATSTSDSNASSFFSDAQRASNAADTGMSPSHSQRLAYEQQSVINHRDQNPGAPVYERRSAYQQTNPRVSVRLPAVKGTTGKQNLLLQEPDLGDLSLEAPVGKNAQDPRRRQIYGGIQPAAGKISHAVPIRDPAAYTGSGLTSRRNQEVLRQNLDTVVASSQGPTGSARTVMNDPQRDRQLSDRPSSTTTNTTVTGSTLRAQAPSYESVTTQHPETTNPPFMKSGLGTNRQRGNIALEGSENLPLQIHVNDTNKEPDRATAGPEAMYLREGFRAPVITPGFGFDAALHSEKAGLPAEAIGAGNAFMNALVRKIPPKQNLQHHVEDSAVWFRTDPRDLSYAAAILPRETMNRMNAEQFPIENRAPHTVGQLANDSQDDDPNDRARQAATPRPIGHGRPAGFNTPPSVHGPSRAASQGPFSVLAGAALVSDKEGMGGPGHKLLEDDAELIVAMFGEVYNNLMSAKNGPYDYLNHYCPPPAYSIDHNAKNDSTLFDPQWFATAPPARVGRDPRREQGEYEDPTQGSARGRGDHARGEVIRRDSGGRGGSAIRGWGRN